MQSSFPLLLVVTVHVLLADHICDQESLWGGALSENFDMFTVANERKCGRASAWPCREPSCALQQNALKMAALVHWHASLKALQYGIRRSGALTSCARTARLAFLFSLQELNSFDRIACDTGAPMC